MTDRDSVLTGIASVAEARTLLRRLLEGYYGEWSATQPFRTTIDAYAHAPLPEQSIIRTALVEFAEEVADQRGDWSDAVAVQLLHAIGGVMKANAERRSALRAITRIIDGLPDARKPVIVAAAQAALAMEDRIRAGVWRQLHQRFGVQVAPVVIAGLARTNHLALLKWLQEHVAEQRVERAFLNALPALLTTLGPSGLAEVLRGVRLRLSPLGAEECDEFANEESLFPEGVLDEMATAELIRQLLRSLAALRGDQSSDAGRSAFEQAAPKIESLMRGLRPSLGLPLAEAYWACWEALEGQRNRTDREVRDVRTFFDDQAVQDYARLREGERLRPNEIFHALTRGRYGRA